MSKKIILFLSFMNEKTAKEGEYICPDGKIVTGKQTNEAPVKYLINKYPDIDEIICITTVDARETAWGTFSKSIEEIKSGIKLTQVGPKLDEKEGKERDPDFKTEVIPEVMKAVNSNDDEILLETTGGLRDAIMNLLLLSRALTYAGAKTVDATYSQIIKRAESKKDVAENDEAKKSEPVGEVKSVMDIVALFDLIAGMQDLTSYGSARVLRQYYESSKDDTIKKLLGAVDQLLEVITLCKTAQIADKMENFNNALNEASKSSDPVFKALLPAFRNAFGKDRRLTIKGLIRWCVKSNMIQQVVTIYTERIPELIMNSASNSKFSKLPKTHTVRQDFEDMYYADFYSGFLKLAETHNSQGCSLTEFRDVCREESNKIIDCYKNGDISKISEKFRGGVSNICLIAKHAYNGGHYNADWINEVEIINKGLANESFCITKGKGATKAQKPKQNVEKFINSIHTLNAELINTLIGNSCKEKYQDVRIKTIENMKEVIKNSGYELKAGVKIDDMQSICRDYLYIKSIRNMMNHANDSTTQAELSDYLKKQEYATDKKYPALNDINTDELKDIIITALKRL